MQGNNAGRRQSHERLCRESQKSTDELFSVIISKPNSNLEAITLSRKVETEKLTKKDVIITCGGTIGLGRIESQRGLHHLVNLAKKNKYKCYNGGYSPSVWPWKFFLCKY